MIVIDDETSYEDITNYLMDVINECPDIDMRRATFQYMEALHKIKTNISLNDYLFEVLIFLYRSIRISKRYRKIIAILTIFNILSLCLIIALLIM